MAINKNVLAESGATVQAEDGNIMYATIQMRHGKEADMDKSKFVPAEMGVATDTKKAFMAFAPNDVKEMAFKEDIPEPNYNDLDNKPSIGDVTLEGNKTLEELGIQPAGDYLTEIPEEYVTDEELGIELEKKLDKNQGEENVGKVLVVGEDGNVAPGETPIKVDSTLTQEGQAADAKATGDALEMLAIKQSASGESPLVVKDSSGFKVQGLKLFGKSRQAQTTGAQLLNKSASGLNRGVSWQFDGSKVTFDGTTTNVNTSSRVYADVEMIDELEVGKTYYSKSFTDVVSTIFRVVREGVDEYPTSVTPDGTETSIMFRAMVNGSDGSEGMKVNLTAYVAVTENNDMVQWEPYTGGAPSPSPNYPQEIEIPGSSGNLSVNATGKNLAIGRLYYVGYTFRYFVVSNESEVILPYKPNNETHGVGYVIQCKIGQTYTFSVTNPNANYNIGLSEYKSFEDSKKYTNRIGGIENIKKTSITYTAVSDGVIVYGIAGTWTDGVTTVHECTESELLQVELGEVATAYEHPKEPQTLTLSTPNGLPGIPVDSGGNYTDADGQQWVCDEIDLERGKYVQRVKKEYLNGVPKFSETTDTPGRFWWTNVLTNPFKRGDYAAISNFAKWNSRSTNNEKGDAFAISNRTIYYKPKDTMTAEEINTVFSEMTASDSPPYVLGQLETPIETDLSPEEIAAYKALHTNYPTTVVTTDADPAPGIELGYVADPKNYIDQNFVPKSDVAQSYTSKSTVQPISAPLAAEMKEDIETLKQQVKSLQESMKEETA